MLSVEWAICHDEQVAYRPLIIWRLIRKNLYSLNFLKNSGKRSARSWKIGAPAGGDTILNMVTLSRSLDIPKTERFRYFSETDIISAGCGFSARTYLYRIFKLKLGCTPTECWEKMTENVAPENLKQD